MLPLTECLDDKLMIVAAVRLQFVLQEFSVDMIDLELAVRLIMPVVLRYCHLHL
jgi:hypothetical protein